MSSELLEELYIHTVIANIPDFFTILIKLVQSFENNNILHNEFYRIVESVLKEPEQNKSALQELLLNDENVLLKFIVAEAEKDKLLKTAEKHTKRKGYIGHVINICRLIDQIDNNELLNQKIKKSRFLCNFSPWIPRSVEHNGRRWYYWNKQESRGLPSEKEPRPRDHVPKRGHPISLCRFLNTLPQTPILTRITRIVVRRGPWANHSRIRITQ